MIRIRTLLCAASAACGLALGFNAFATTFTFDLPCDSLTANGNSITCNTSGGTGPTASCSLSPLNKSVAIPGTQNVTMTCTNMTGNVVYNWTSGCTTAVGNVCTVTSTSVQTVNVGVTATDDGTDNISKSTTVVFFDPNATGGGTIPSTCGDGTKTVKASQMNAFDGLPVVVDPFGKSQTAVYTMNVPGAASGAKFVFSWSSFGGTSDQIARKIWISKTPCDMTSTGIVANGQAFSGSINGVLNDGTSGITGKVGSNVIHMQSGETWFIMVQNLNSSGKNTCTVTDCPLVIKPQSAS